MDQQPQSIIKKPSKICRILRSIFGSCGRKSVEKTLVEDEKDGNTDYSSSFSSSGMDSDSEGEDDINLDSLHTQKGEIEKQKADELSSLLKKLEEEEKEKEDEDEKDGNTDYSFSFSFSSSGLGSKSKDGEGLTEVEDGNVGNEEDEDEKDGNTDYSFSFSSSGLDSEEDYCDFEVLIEETSARMDSLRTQKGEIEKQKADELSSLLKKLEEKDSDFEFPTFADDIRPVFPIFGRDVLDGVPASDASAVAESPERCKKNNKRVKPTVAGGGVTLAPGRDRRRLLMPYRREGYFANVNMRN